MGMFLLLAVLLVLIAVAFAVGTLWRGSRQLALMLAVALPLAATGLYRMHGTPAALDPRNTAPLEADADAMSMDEAIAGLEQRVAAKPDDLDGLVLLARSYMALERYEKAPAVFARAVALAPDDVDLSVDYAESLLRASVDHRFPPEAVARLEDAIARQPQHQRGLFFLGLVQLQGDQPAQAAATWERLLPLLEPDAAAALREQVDVARGAAGLPPLPPSATTEAAGLDITVELGPAVASQVPPGAVLFVFARTPEGRGPPLAAKRLAPGTWPVHLRLSDADSPMPAGKLSSVPQAVLVARLSAGGVANAASGDIESAPQTVATDGKAPVVLVLDRVLP
jgi:cytochrome c-type biogenesis protein CcmH